MSFIHSPVSDVLKTCSRRQSRAYPGLELCSTARHLRPAGFPVSCIVASSIPRTASRIEGQPTLRPWIRSRCNSARENISQSQYSQDDFAVCLLRERSRRNYTTKIGHYGMLSSYSVCVRSAVYSALWSQGPRDLKPPRWRG